MKMAFRWQSILWPKTERGKSALFWATVFAGIWLLLQGLSGFCLGFNPVRVPPAAWAMALLGIFARELLRAFLSALPKGSSFWRGLAIAFALALGECLLTGGTANLPLRLWSE